MICRLELKIWRDSMNKEKESRQRKRNYITKLNKEKSNGR